jgi:hypothetical protein
MRGGAKGWRGGTSGVEIEQRRVLKEKGEPGTFEAWRPQTSRTFLGRKALLKPQRIEDDRGQV